MADDTHTPPVSTEPEVKTHRWCSWHKDVADDALVVRTVERPSYGPYLLYACGPCRDRYGLTEWGECS